MTGREYRQDDTTEGYCDCGEPLANVTVGGRGFCEIHGWRDANWHAGYDHEAEMRDLARRLDERDPGDETDEREAQP